MSDEAVESNSIQVEVSAAVNLEPETLHSTAASGNNRTSESDLAKGLSSIISSVITDFDSRAQQTIHSQHQLSSSIDRLTGELDQLLKDAPLPFIMQHAAKISGVRKRVSSLNSVLKSVQRRIDNIDRTLSAGLSHDEAVESNSIQVEDSAAVNLEPETLHSTAASGNNRTSESDLAKGLSSIISSVITDFDSRAQQTIHSQHQLSFSIDRVTRAGLQ